ncbi:class I SAM-dependent methyltransferase [Bacillus pseudomycoides]|uniref:class I SAM-dependent methyltransferase n=1 Tax=Bacillus pseudomycoides TaxID=64104 RepID=UPI000BEBB877|nr:SAM-dependent methyltransferase [Bacillus pseudomycoides]PEF22705.1 SAM-dependent methyltransferase [Bacillus pseudomycoides]PGD72908.1 SAM-dependent methyltransferase [Bacillus pseudomycoides]
MMVVKDELKIVVGAGEINNNRGWLHTNEDELNLLKREDWIKRFDSNSLEVILAEHVWEHLSYEEGVEAAKVCYEFLKNGGYIRCAVPDSFFPDEEYQEGVQVGGPGPLDHPAASHKIVHNYKTIISMFESAGFQVKLLEYCDESGEFHYNDWDEKEGFIYRSKRFDHRNQDGKLGFVSLIVDAVKGE